jgi:hypothetical protein
MAFQLDGSRGSATGAEHFETIGPWVTVRQAADDVDRSVDWVRRQYRSGTVASVVRHGRYGPERLVDIHALREAAVAPRRVTASRSTPGASLPVLAETVHELARQLGEAQERAARAEAEAEELRRRLEAHAGDGDGVEAAPPAAGAETGSELRKPRAGDDGASDPGGPSADGRPPDELSGPDHHETLWLAANEHFLRTLPSAAARQEAGNRLLGGRRIEPGHRPRRRLWPR